MDFTLIDMESGPLDLKKLFPGSTKVFLHGVVKGLLNLGGHAVILFDTAKERFEGIMGIEKRSQSDLFSCFLVNENNFFHLLRNQNHIAAFLKKSRRLEILPVQQSRSTADL